ncbi:hypothetical protein [Pseudomonas syringae]|nr:hypothetical protein [Pseudomonas syringae]
MNRKLPPANCRPQALPPLQVLCRKCRLIQHRRLPAKRLATGAGENDSYNRQSVTNALLAGVMLSWEALPERNRRALNIDLATMKKGDDAALTDLARLLVECADVLFKQALAIRNKRLAEHEGLPQG